jgi:iron complex transport system substrate-binding protein
LLASAPYRAAVLRAALLLGLVLAACSARASERNGPPKRVITLTPSATELVAAVGGQDLLVGVDQFSTRPAAVRALPKVGDFLTPDIEAIVALRPDLVILDDVQTQVDATLRGAGIATLPLPLQTIDDVRTALITLGTILGRSDIATVKAARLDLDLAEITEKAKIASVRAEHPPRVLFVVDRRPGSLAGMVAAGPGTYVDELLRRAGVANAFADSPVRYAQISREEVLARAPDIIIDASHTDDTARAVRDWQGLTSVPAVARGRVHVLGDTLFVTPGPRLAEALGRLVAVLWPESP